MYGHFAERALAYALRSPSDPFICAWERAAGSVLEDLAWLDEMGQLLDDPQAYLDRHGELIIPQISVVSTFWERAAESLAGFRPKENGLTIEFADGAQVTLIIQPSPRLTTPDTHPGTDHA